ncbi:hypothetical protein BKA62DRAFT_593638, partial [Auriculariales sp. MPI-PUGE-AT-0066]
APVYAFYHPFPKVVVNNEGKDEQHFICTHANCKRNGAPIKRVIGGTDDGSTSNLRGHAKSCWGQAAVNDVDKMPDAAKAREMLSRPISEKLTATFMRTGKGKVSFSTTTLTTYETRYAPSPNKLRPFAIVDDEAYRVINKSGRPSYELPTSRQVSADVRTVFEGCRELIREQLTNNPAALNFSADCWSSPNRKPVLGISVHYEKDGRKVSHVLDTVVLAQSHTGGALAQAF